MNNVLETLRGGVSRRSFLKRNVHDEKVKTLTPSLITRAGYTIQLVTVISRADCMILRCRVQMPFDDCDVVVLPQSENGRMLPSRCVFLGCDDVALSVAGKRIYKELKFSVFLAYPEQNLILEVQDKESHETIHQQMFGAEEIAKLRKEKDNVLYKSSSNGTCYMQWLMKKHRPCDYELQLQREACLCFEPKFSIVVPLYKTPISFLEELTNSVKAQTYSNWELILVNASPEDEELLDAVKKVRESDSRIKAVRLEKNEGITLNTAYGIELAEGDFVSFVDHDDVLEPNCLFEYAQRINDVPDTEVLYCDEDLFQTGEPFYGPFFKPDFSLYLLRSHNYITHMLTIKRDLLKLLEYDNKLYEGAQDYHLTLQASERAKCVEHIAKVLYHWRASSTSVAGDGEKPYANEATVRAVSDHLKRMDVEADVKHHESVAFRTQIAYKMKDGSNPKVSLIVPNTDGLDLLKKCIGSVLKKTNYENYEIIVVANTRKDAKTLEYCKILEKKENVNLCKFEENLNFAELMNLGRKNATGDYLLFLKDDIQIATPNWIKNLIGVCCQPDVGVVGCKILNFDDTIQFAGGFIGDVPHNFFSDLPKNATSWGDYSNLMREVSAVSATCMMADAKIFDSVQGFNESLNFSFADIDFCLRVRGQEKLVIYNPFTEVYHLHSGFDVDAPKSYAYEKSVSDFGEMLAHWSREFVEVDPYFSQNLSQAPSCLNYNFLR